MNRLLPMALIVLLLVIFRVIGSAFPESIPNFQPLAALFFCGAMMIKGWKGWVIPLVAWLVTYPAPAILSGNASYLSVGGIAITALAFAITYFIGKSLSERSVGVLLVGSIVAAISFHLVTNGAAWMSSPLYPKTGAGLWQSLWTGPLFSAIPSWVFLRNMVAANLLFTAIFLSARFALPQVSTNQEPIAAR